MLVPPRQKTTAPGGVLLVFNQFPKLSETFLLREVEYWAAAGLKVQPVSLLNSLRSELTPGMLRWRNRTVYLQRWVRPSRWTGALQQVFRESRDVRYLLKAVLKPSGHRIRFELESIAGWAAGLALAQLSRESGAAHLHALWANAPAMAACVANRLTGIPYSVSIHAADYWRAGPRLAPRLKPARWIVACNRRVYRQVQKDLPELDGRLFLRPHGIDAGRFLPLKRTAASTWRLLSVGRLVEKKGLPTLIRACGRLKAQGLDFHCEIIGAGPMAGVIHRLIRRLDLRERVQMRGAQPPSEVARAMRRSHIFILSSQTARCGDREGLPNVVLEALLSQLPVIATRTGSVEEAIVPGQTGLLVAPQRPDLLAQAVMDVTRDYGHFLRLARAGRRKVVLRARGENQGTWLARRFAEVARADPQSPRSRPECSTHPLEKRR